MHPLRIEINRRWEGQYQGFGDSVLADSVEAAIRLLNALPDDSLSVEAADDDWERTFFLVEHGPDGLHAVAN